MAHIRASLKRQLDMLNEVAAGQEETLKVTQKAIAELKNQLEEMSPVNKMLLPELEERVLAAQSAQRDRLRRREEEAANRVRERMFPLDKMN